MSRLRQLAVFLAILAAVLVTSGTTFAQTLVGGAITTNTTWTTANSPYEVTSEIVIYNQARLTIQPGVTVRFNSGTGMIVGYYAYFHGQVNGQERGALTVNGTAAQPVIFTSKSNQTNGWKGLSFGDATDYGGLASSLNYLVVEKAGQAQTMGGSIGAVSANILLYATGTTFTWNNVEANGGAGHGFYLTGSTLNTTAAKAQSNTLNGVHAINSSISLSGMTISGNGAPGGAAGVYLSGTSGTLTASTIASNSGYGVDTTGGSPTISNNTISGNGNYGIRYVIGNAPVITGNTLSSNTNPGIQVVGGALTTNHTWALQNGETSFTVTGAEIVVYNVATLTVAAGVTVKFSSGTGLIIGYYVYFHGQVNGQERGKLVVNGTAGSRVLFTAQNGLSGGWKGVFFGDATDHSGLFSTMSNLTVEKAGQAQNLGGSIGAISANIALFNTGTSFTWTNVESNGGTGYGTYISGSTFTSTGGGAAGNANYNLLMTSSSGTITGATLQTSNTGGAYVEASTPTFSACTIQNNLGTGVHVRAGSTPTLTGGALKGNRGYAVFTEDLGSVSAISNVSVDGNGRGADGSAGTADDTYVMRVSARSAVKTNTFANTAKTGIELIGGGVVENFRWFLPGTGDYQHYVVLHELVVYNIARLTVDAGVTAKFAPGTGLIIGYYVYFHGQVNGQERGALTVNGTSSAPVTFTALNGQKGGWRGVAFGDASDYALLANTMTYFTVDRAGEAQTLGGSVGATAAGIMMFNTGTSFTMDHVSATNSGVYGFYVSGSTWNSTYSAATDNNNIGVHALNSDITLQGATVAHNNATGIYLSGTSGLVTGSLITDNANYGIDTTGAAPTLSSNTISDSDNYAIRYIIGNAPVITSNTFSNNFNQGIEVVGGTLTTNHTWSYQTGEPFFSVTGAEIVVYNIATLTTAAGVTTKFSPGTGLIIGHPEKKDKKAAT